MELPTLFGIDTPHEPDYHFDHKGIAGLSLAMCFRTPAMVFCGEGFVEAQPGDCFIHTPTFRQAHHALKGSQEGFRNDWLYAKFALVDKAVRQTGLSYNTPLRTGQPDLFEPLVKTLQREHSTSDEFSMPSVEAMLLSTFIAVARAMRASSFQGRKRLPEFRALRSKALSDFKHQWTVEEMAHSLSLSAERFSALYREYFGISPISDLIEARMLCARRLLSYSGLSVKEIALQCGFEDIHYFSRVFRRKVGFSPSKYRSGFLA